MESSLAKPLNSITQLSNSLVKDKNINFHVIINGHVYIQSSLHLGF